uniref:Uncharacterized protein n=1 Tax=Tanacetum cinerariifolium TaxID=118510 RepID=A0A6L2NV86_TANCI|nr:hypothetical protein [Tanacetum cinerariifolium]
MNTSQDIKMQMVDDNVVNQVRHNVVQNDGNECGNGNVVTAPTEGNGNGINGIQSTKEEFEFMADADAYEETERVKVNCTSEDTLLQASTFRTQFDNAPVYDSDGSSKKLKDENVSLEFQVLCYAKENAHLKTTYKNMFDSIKVTQAKTNSIIDSLQKQLYDTIYENAKLRAQLFDKVSKTKGTTKAMQTVNLIAPRIFRTNPSKTSRVDNVVPNKPIKTSVRIKPITVSQPNVIHKQQAKSDLNNFSSTRVNNTTKTRRPHPRRNSNTARVPSKPKSSCLSNNVEKIEENHKNSRIPKNQKHISSECNNIMLAIRNAKFKIVCVILLMSENVKNQKKHKANAKKSKELGSKGSLASSRPSKPRSFLRWISARRIFAMCGKLTASSKIENKSEKSMCDSASTSNPSEPSSKGFLISTSLLGRLSRLRKQHTSIYPIDVL